MLQTRLDEFRHVSAPAYQSLLVYYTACRSAAANVIMCRNFPWLPYLGRYCWAREQYACKCIKSNTRYMDGQSQYRLVVEWWVDFMEAIARLLREQPEPTHRICHSSTLTMLKKKLVCDACQQAYLNDLHDFLPMLQEQVQKVISKVRSRIVLQTIKLTTRMCR